MVPVDNIQATCTEGGLDIASNSGLEGDRVTDLCGTARLGGQVCPLEVWLRVQTVSCDDGRLDPAHDLICTWSCQWILAIWHWHFMWKASSFFMSAASRVQFSHAYVKIGRTRVW